MAGKTQGPQLLQLQVQDDSDRIGKTELEGLLTLRSARHYCFERGVRGRDLDFVLAFRTLNHLYTNLLRDISARNANKWPPSTLRRRVERAKARQGEKP